MSEIRICKYCGMELLEDVPHGLRNCHLRAVARLAELEGKFDQLTAHDATERQDDKWIPVSERLPRDGEYVLAAFTDTILTATYHRQWTGFVGLDDWLDIEGRHSGTPTHWLPLPPNPESPNDTQTQTFVYGKESELRTRIVELEARLESCESALASMVYQFFYQPELGVLAHSFMSAEEEACEYLIKYGIAHWSNERKNSIVFDEVQELPKESEE